MSGYKTSDYCGRCGESPDSGAHWLPVWGGGCEYAPPRSLQEVVDETVFNARTGNIVAHLGQLEQRIIEVLALFRDEPWKRNPAAHDAWQLALECFEPLRAAINRARKAGEGQ